MGTYGGRSFSKKSPKTDFLGSGGDRGIPPSMPGFKGSRKGIEFLGKEGDKGLSEGAKPKSSGSPKD